MLLLRRKVSLTRRRVNMMGEPKESSLALVSHGMASRPGVWGELVNL